MTDLLDVRIDSRDGATVAYVRGEVDLTSAPQLNDALLSAGASATVLIVDLTAAVYLDSAGLAVLHTASRKMAESGGQLRLVITEQSVVYRALDISGLALTIPTHPTLDAALANGTP
jgi:anti-sigma B factor antagonist